MPDQTDPQKEAVEFVLALMNPQLTDRQVAWIGLKAVLAFSDANSDVAALRKGVARLVEIADAPES